MSACIVLSYPAQSVLQEPSSSGTKRCQLSEAAKQGKETLLQSALKGNNENRYKTLLKEDAEQLRQCRSRTWLKPRQSGCACTHVTFNLGHWTTHGDSSTGAITRFILGFFYDGQVLLPPWLTTVWPAVVRVPERKY